MKTRILTASLLIAMLAPLAWGATVYSNKYSYMGPGLFYGPGRIADVPIFDVTIRNVGFRFPLNFVTPFVNNGGAEPNICAEEELGLAPTGMLSDGVTLLNENVDACAFEINGTKILAGIIHGGYHQGEQISVVFEDGVMIMTMDFALDMGIGKGGIMKLPFYGTTGEVTLPLSLQSQMGIEGGIDQAGSMKSGDKLQGRLGDYNGDGMLDGAIVVAGNMPLDSILLPGAPYALIRYFETDIPYEGKMFGHLQGVSYDANPAPKSLPFFPPAKRDADTQNEGAPLDGQVQQPMPMPAGIDGDASGPNAGTPWMDAAHVSAADVLRTGAYENPSDGSLSLIDLWSNQEITETPGQFYGPGATLTEQVLFETHARNMIVVTDVDLVTPYVNNLEAEPNIRADVGPTDGRLSDGTLINENVDLGTMVIAGQTVYPAVVHGRRLEGQQVIVRNTNGHYTLSMDLALDFGTQGVVTIPFLATTSSTVVPQSLQTRTGKQGGVDQAGKLPSGTRLEGRIGDYNKDGYIDGTFVAAGNFPLDAPLFAGQPYAVHQNFELSIPVTGARFGKTYDKHPQGIGRTKGSSQLKQWD